MSLPKQVRIVEVGPRDGLQNESQPVSVDTKLALIDWLADSGLQVIESGSFVSPKWVPQMAGSRELFQRLQRRTGVTYSALTPNLRGLEDALSVGVEEVAVFAAASESFSQKNINCSIAESLERFQPLMEKARQFGVPVRGYVSTVIGCPYEGAIAPAAVASVSQALFDMGCYEVSLGDTIGVGTPATFVAMLDAVAAVVPVEKLAVHCHDTYGMAVANIYASLQQGISVVDAAVAGLGGCPYAKGATGNVATEEVVYLMHGLGIETGIDLSVLVQAGRYISESLKRPYNSRVGKALLARAEG